MYRIGLLILALTVSATAFATEVKFKDENVTSALFEIMPDSTIQPQPDPFLGSRYVEKIMDGIECTLNKRKSTTTCSVKRDDLEIDINPNNFKTVYVEFTEDFSKKIFDLMPASAVWATTKHVVLKRVKKVACVRELDPEALLPDEKEYRCNLLFELGADE
ncbi:hypothetical protein ACFLRA_00855 [Bdellovibrionota bacterium]